MDKGITDFAYIEQELAELRNQLKQSFKVIEGLAQVQHQFEDLAQTHQRYQDYLTKHQTALAEVTQFQQAIERRIAELEDGFQHQWETLRGELDADRNFGDRLEHLQAQLREQQIAAAESADQQQTTLQSVVEQTEQRLISELQASLERINQSSASTVYVEKLDAQLRTARSSLRSMEKQARTMRAWLAAVTVLLALLALWVPASGLFTQPTTGTPLSNSLN